MDIRELTRGGEKTEEREKEEGKTEKAEKRRKRKDQDHENHKGIIPSSFNQVLHHQFSFAAPPEEKSWLRACVHPFLSSPLLSSPLLSEPGNHLQLTDKRRYRDFSPSAFIILQKEKKRKKGRKKENAPPSSRTKMSPLSPLSPPLSLSSLQLP